MKRTLCSIAAVITLIAGCGGGDSDGESVASSIVEGSDAEREQEEGDGLAADERDEDADTAAESDEAIAEAAVLKLSDFEPGWRVDDEDEDENEDDEELDCPGLDKFEDDDAPSAESEDFTQDQSFVSNVVMIGEDEEEAKELLGLVSQDEIIECLRDELQTMFEEEPDFGEDFDDVSSEVGELSVGDFGDDAAGLQFVFSLEGDISLEFYMDLIFVRRGRAVSMFVFVDLFSPAAAERNYLIEAVDDRLARSGV